MKYTKTNNKKGGKNPPSKKGSTAVKKDNSALLRLIPYILGLVAVFFAACLIFTDVTGAVGLFFNNCFKGCFSVGAYLIPVVMLIRSVYFSKDMEKGMVFKWVLSVCCILLVSIIYGMFFPVADEYDGKVAFDNGIQLSGAGAIGALLSGFCIAAVGKIATAIISAILLIVSGSFIFGKSPVEIFGLIVGNVEGKIGDMRDNARDKKLAREEERERQRQLEEKKQAELLRKECAEKRREGFKVDPTEDEEAENDNEIPAPPQKRTPQYDEDGELPGFDEDGLMTPAPAQASRGARPAAEDLREAPASVGETLQNVFSKKEDPELSHRFTDSLDGLDDEDDEELEAQTSLEVKRTIHSTIEEDEAPQPEEAYVFPPVSLLQYEPVRKSGNTQEQEQTANKLVETLASFGVKTKILDVAVGPTVTRYELQPDIGVRVRSIVNLADDIALNLAASGVRIEAPIPGKEAVGIEVPNKSVATVYLRELIDSSAFKDAESKLTVCLGMDVAGKPIFCNITKMPHLLIAGATNMGKSVCMNSVITSILYKATPDEVKLILIDPKKVEMSIYNGIPHLIVPVVSEPKKAAGALAWAVSEMERRFALIEEEGVRNIANYNKAIAGDPERQKEPYIVIVIDELADLMMTARDDVESSICRLAQKARAAGIHLIIGTQRPSVDVITGLIKANFPSRIAFTVSSQVDSRTIIDIAGAEKLMGRGDMLYAPVGSTKPTRVQGSFVSEAEVEEITDFLREHKVAEYSREIQEQIEKEAARCGEKKHSAGFDADPDASGAQDDDPMLAQAIKLSIENGKISTSFIQRKLQLGYSRAGRITDIMGNMGVIGPFNGSKPREVLWDMNRYMEWMNQKSDSSEPPIQ
ncbi:MAG: DNA translocase FtsK [Ruminococcaceae bacterium]|nr:DNA translocase FtsK [Oscillospiraceae bacterium]